MTSANVIEFAILKNGVEVGQHRQNVMCMTRYHELLKFQPLEEHEIYAYGYDEEEDYWEEEPENLLDFMKSLQRHEKEIREYFESLNR